MKRMTALALAVMLAVAQDGLAAAQHKAAAPKVKVPAAVQKSAAPASSIQPLPLPPYKVAPDVLLDKGGDIQSTVVGVQLGRKDENPLWAMSPTVLQVWLGKLQDEVVPPLDPRLSAGLRDADPKYRGLTVAMRTVDGHPFEVLTVYKGRVTGTGGRLVKLDPGRGLEYWLFSTARVKRDLLVGPATVPVVTFEQCRLLGMDVVETEPRQCLLPDKNILLQTDEKPTKASVSIKDFDGCLHRGSALIPTFPRRCLAAGGRVFTEPPRVPETPADAPLAPGGTAVPASMAVTPSSSVTPTLVVNPLLGTYAVSGTVSTTQVVSEGLGLSGTVPSPTTFAVPAAVAPVAVSPGTVAPASATAFPAAMPAHDEGNGQPEDMPSDPPLDITPTESGIISGTAALDPVFAVEPAAGPAREPFSEKVRHFFDYVLPR